MRARDVMSRPVVSVHPWNGVREAAVLLTEAGVAALPVVDEEDRVVGVISQSDVLGHGVGRPGSSVATVMSPVAEVVSVDDELADIADRLLRSGVRSVPVVQDGVLMGIIGRRDLLRVLVRDDDMIASQVRRYLADYAGSRRRWRVDVVDGHVTIAGEFADEAERRVIAALARTVSGVVDVQLFLVNDFTHTSNT